MPKAIVPLERFSERAAKTLALVRETEDCRAQVELLGFCVEGLNAEVSHGALVQRQNPTTASRYRPIATKAQQHGGAGFRIADPSASTLGSVLKAGGPLDGISIAFSIHANARSRSPSKP
jgi:hypothetical protein